MARLAKQQQLTEETVEEPEVNEAVTAAQDSLRPNSHPSTDPREMPNRIAMLSKMIGATHAMTDEDLIKLFDGMMAYHDKAGSGMGVGDNSGHNRGTLTTHPSDASSTHTYGQEKMPMPRLAMKEAIKQDVSKLLDSEDGLSGEFKEKATTLFEAAIDAQVNAVIAELEESYQQSLDQEMEEVSAGLVESLDTYLDYVAKEWLTENEVAIESALRNQMTAEFINGLRTLFQEHNVNIPEEQVDIVDTMATKIEELEVRVSDLISENAALKEAVSESEKKEAVDQIAEGLTLQQATKLRELAETVSADDLDGFVKKVTVIKESNFVKGVNKGIKTQTLTESMEEVDPDNAPIEDENKNLEPRMRRYINAITRTSTQL
jgi:hypothetical protein